MSARKHVKQSARSTVRRARFTDVFSDADYPFDEDDAIGPTDPTTSMASLNEAPDSVIDLSQITPSALRIAAPLSRRAQKKERLAEATEKRLREIQASKRRWSHGEPEQMERKYQEIFEEGLVKFFRSGFEKNFYHGRPAREDVILSFIKEVITHYKLRISGGFVLKNMGLSVEDRSKPSVDVDIYVPFHIPDRNPEFYEIMALLFNCDPGWDEDHPFKIRKFVTNRAKGKRKGFFDKNGIYSVFKHERNVDGLYAEMDLVRGQSNMPPEKIIRNFDLSVCMNWYDGKHIYAMDKEAILDKENTTGWLNYSYLHLLLGIKNEYGTKWQKNPVTRDRILKYLLRGYRISYVHPTEGKVYEIISSDLPNAVLRLPANKREQYYRSHPNERPNNAPQYFENNGEVMVNNMNSSNVNNVVLRSHFGGRTRKNRH